MMNLVSPGIRDGASRLRGGGGGRDAVRTPHAWEGKFSPLSDKWKRKLHSSPTGACRHGPETQKVMLPSPPSLDTVPTSCGELFLHDLISSSRSSLRSGGLFILPPHLRNVRVCEGKCPMNSHIGTLANSGLMSTSEL